MIKSPHILELCDVTRVHGAGPTAVRALGGVSLSIDRGELVAVMGPSGSGKSTLLNLAGGLDRPSAGSVWVEGADLTRMSATDTARLRRQRLGYVFQDFNLLPTLTAVENVALPLELDGIRMRQAMAIATISLEGVGLSGLESRFPDQLSGGQQQRVAIARAVVGTRSLILADEPTGALDSQTGEQVLRLIRGLCEAGSGALLVTHEARHAAWADRIVFLRDGLAVSEAAADSPDELLAGT